MLVIVVDESLGPVQIEHGTLPRAYQAIRGMQESWTPCAAHMKWYEHAVLFMLSVSSSLFSTTLPEFNAFDRFSVEVEFSCTVTNAKGNTDTHATSRGI
jgi:hypothetical protein